MTSPVGACQASSSNATLAAFPLRCYYNLANNLTSVSKGNKNDSLVQYENDGAAIEDDSFRFALEHPAQLRTTSTASFVQHHCDWLRQTKPESRGEAPEITVPLVLPV